MAGSLIFKNAEIAKDAIMASQKKEIAALYESWADEIGERAKHYSLKSTASSVVSERQMKELQKMLKTTSQQVSNEVYGLIKNNIYTISDAVVADNVKWLESFGFSSEGLNAAFNFVPDNVVRNLITGQIYDSGWSLSKAIWSDNEKALKDIYQITAKGIAQNMPVYEIAKNLESYVRPSAKKNWNPLLATKNTKTGKIEYKRIYKKQVDYNAQRLARTLVQHGYQQSFIATTQKNPFITEYIWHSNGSRVCPLCLDRDGATFQKDALPMDHPNGMCVMEPVVAKDMVDQLADWFNSPDGTYPEIDAFAGNFGYEAKKGGTVNDYLTKYGKSDKTLSAWKQSMSPIQKAEAKLLKDAEGLTWEKFYSKYVYSGDVSDVAEHQAKIKAAKAAKKAAKKAPKETVQVFSDAQEKYLKPYGFSPQNMPVDFDDWSHKISHDQASEILKSMGTSWGDPHPYQQLMKYYNANLTSSNLASKAVSKVDDVIAATKTTKAAKAAKVSGKAPEITTWIDNIKMQTESHMLDLEKESMRIIGEAGRSGIKRYTGSAYHEMNTYLRHLQNGLDEATAIAKSGISSTDLAYVKDAISGLNNAKLTEDLVLRRGTDLGDLAGAFMSGDFKTNKSSLYGKSAEELNDMFSGAVGQLGSFTSTSSMWDRGFSGDVEVVFYAPKGASASSIMSISRYDTGEGETLLNAGTKVRCVKVEKSDGHFSSSIRVFMEILTK